MVKVAELWDQLTWLRGRFGLLRTTSWTLTQVGLEVSKVEVTFRMERSCLLAARKGVVGMDPGSQGVQGCPSPGMTERGEGSGGCNRDGLPPGPGNGGCNRSDGLLPVPGT